MRELGFVHQHCTFHLLLNIYDNIRPELTKMRKEFERNLKNMELNSRIINSKKNQNNS